MAVHVVVMGVSGCGKSTVAAALRDRFGFDMLEGDDLHPRANVEKMRSGTPLSDGDREPWLRAVGAWMARREREGRDTVVSCSALKRGYRDLLRGEADVWFLHLDGAAALVGERLRARRGHFMPASLLASQFDALEPLAADEDGATIAVEGSVEEVVGRAVAAVEAYRAGHGGDDAPSSPIGVTAVSLGEA